MKYLFLFIFTTTVYASNFELFPRQELNKILDSLENKPIFNDSIKVYQGADKPFLTEPVFTVRLSDGTRINIRPHGVHQKKPSSPLNLSRFKRVGPDCLDSTTPVITYIRNPRTGKLVRVKVEPPLAKRYFTVTNNGDDITSSSTKLFWDNDLKYYTISEYPFHGKNFYIHLGCRETIPQIDSLVTKALVQRYLLKSGIDNTVLSDTTKFMCSSDRSVAAIFW